MSTKQDLQKQVKALKNQVTQLKKKKRSNVMPTSSRKKANKAPLSTIPTWSGEGRPLRIHQVERVATITSNSTAGSFKCDAFEINPADTTTFPWLSSIATLFDKYKFHSLKFTYINNAPATSAGCVTLAVDFDTLDSTPANGTAMSNLAKFRVFAPWKMETLDVPVNRPGVLPWLFTKDSNTSTNDPKSYNIGKVFVSTEGMSASQVAGYLIVEYDVELIDKNPN